MPWEKAYDQTEVLERAMRQFWSRGYEATSINDLVKAMGINRGSIYSAYESKHALFLHALRRYDKIYRRQYLADPAHQYIGTEAIIAVFDEAAKAASRKGDLGGCLLVNTALELSPHDPDVRQLVNACFREMEQFFVERIEEARIGGDVDSHIDARETAQGLLGLLLGLRVMTRSMPRRGAINGVLNSAKALLT